MSFLPPLLKMRLDAIDKTLSKYLFVNVRQQKMYLVKNQKNLEHFDVSTALRGIGNLEGSLQTPQGIHRIAVKIGAGAPLGRVFRDRQDTGITIDDTDQHDNRIVSRILRLAGLEDGINRGGTIDTFNRYVYIHGTNKEHLIGTPFSHGCVCMRNLDIIRLFDNVKEGDYVIID